MPITETAARTHPEDFAGPRSSRYDVAEDGRGCGEGDNGRCSAELSDGPHGFEVRWGWLSWGVRRPEQEVQAQR